MKITSKQSYNDLFFWIGVYFILLLLILLPIFSVSGGMVYPLDDVYIHLTMAKNLFQNGTWGMFSNENISASSSPLYTLLLSPLTFNESIAILAPIVLNVIASLLLLYQLHLLLQTTLTSSVFRYVIGIVFILLIPLPSLTVMGMEHLIHCLFIVIIIRYTLTESLTKNILPLFISFSIFLRLETTFVIGGLLAWCLLERKWGIIVQLLIGCCIGIFLYFLLSVIFTIPIIPNTILLKTIISNDSFLQTTIHKVWNSKLLLGISVLSFITLIIQWKKSKLFLIVFITSLLQLVLSRQGWFFRYEAFVITLFFVVGLIEFLAIIDQKKKIFFIIIACIFLLLCGKRAFLSMTTTHLASKNIYDQQIQMAIIIKTLPISTNIAVNDIGAVSYYNDNKILDLYGIASKDVFMLKKSNSFTPEKVQGLLNSNNIDCIFVYSSWFDANMFERYTPIHKLHLYNNVVCGDSLVTIFQTQNSNNKLHVQFP